MKRKGSRSELSSPFFQESRGTIRLSRTKALGGSISAGEDLTSGLVY